MDDAVDLDAGDSRALKRGQENAAERVAKGRAEATLKRLDDELGFALRIPIVLNNRTVGADQVFPVFVVHRTGGLRHGFSLFSRS